jgi:membrane-bound ClpP family serine protease
MLNRLKEMSLDDPTLVVTVMLLAASTVIGTAAYFAGSSDRHIAIIIADFEEVVVTANDANKQRYLELHDLVTKIAAENGAANDANKQLHRELHDLVAKTAANREVFKLVAKTHREVCALGNNVSNYYCKIHIHIYIYIYIYIIFNYIHLILFFKKSFHFSLITEL